MTALPAVAAALREWSPGLYFPPWPARREPLVPWLAPDGRPWLTRHGFALGATPSVGAADATPAALAVMRLLRGLS